MASIPTAHYPKENEGPHILGATLSITIVALVTMIARLFVRLKMIRNVGWDDYVMCMAMLLCVAGLCIIVPEVHYGAGKHIDQILEKNFQEAFKLNFVTQPIYLFAICLVKESIGFFLLRIAIIPFYRRLIITIMVFMALYTIACFFTIVFQCTNLAVQWDPNVKGTCWGASILKGLSYTNVSLNILTDLLFAIIIPIPMLWQVQMNRRQKLSIFGILGLGIFATVAALVKVSYLPNYGRTGDWLWDSRNITIWTVIECNVGIIAGNLPCLKPLFKSVLGSTYARGSRSRTTPKYLSRPYGAGTGQHHSSKRNYDSLASNKTPREQFSPYGIQESHMMTTVGANKDRNGSASSTGGKSSAGKNSAESVVLLGDQPQALGNIGGILRTTEVSTQINLTGSRVKDLEDGLRPERKAEHMV